MADAPRPACRRPLDDGRCAILMGTRLWPNALALVALSHVACTGAPGANAVRLVEPIP